MNDMIEMIVGGLAIDQNSGRPVLLLTDIEKKYAMPIVIGMPEAKAISLGMGNINVGRPLTHELLLDVVDNLDYEVTKVDITEIENHTYKSSLHLMPKTKSKNKSMKVIDARPSDAIALAVRKGIPIFANEALVTKEFLLLEDKKEKTDREEFKSFIQNLKASDFNLEGFEPDLEELD